MRKQINVVGAVIVRNGEVLCAQRGPGGSLAGMWEFPGGKIEHGETARAALEREIGEELLCSVVVGDEVVTTTHAYDFGDVTLTTFYCELVDGTPSLTEHAAVVWLPANELPSLHWAPADIPAVEKIARFSANVGPLCLLDERFASRGEAEDLVVGGHEAADSEGQPANPPTEG